MDGLALTKLDVARGRASVRICVAYRIGQDVVEELPDVAWRTDAEPIYEECEGWPEHTGDARALGELPRAARTYIARLETLLGVPLDLVSVGPERSETILLRDSFS